MDNLGKKSYNEDDLVYLYKNSIKTPPLMMVDDILNVSKCGNKSIQSNSIINTFIKSKKLNF